MKKSINDFNNLVDYFTDGKFALINKNNEYVARSGIVTDAKFTKNKGESYFDEKEKIEEIKQILENEQDIKDLIIVKL